MERIDTASESVLVLKGSLRIEAAEQLRTDLLQALESSQPLITLDLEGVDAVDVTFFQLALAFRQALEARGRHLLVRELVAPHPVAVTAALLGLPLAHHFTLVQAQP